MNSDRLYRVEWDHSQMKVTSERRQLHKANPASCGSLENALLGGFC